MNRDGAPLWPVVTLNADREANPPLRYVCLVLGDGPAEVIALAGMMTPIGTLL
jgi:hypothetical protein